MNVPYKKWYVFLFALLLAFTFSCARQSKLVSTEKAQKIKESPEAATYLKFIESELERYQETPEDSLVSIDAAIKNEPDVGYLYYQRAIINASAGRWEGVDVDCKTALAKDPRLLNAKVLIGNALGVLGKHDESIRYLEEVRREDPSREDAYTYLAKEYMNVEKYREAEKVMLSLLARDTEAMIAYYYLGAIYGAYLKEPKKAIEVFKHILEREPDNAQVIDAVSQLYVDTDQVNKALELLLNAEKSHASDVSLKLKIARIYYKMKNYPEAIRRFEEILKTDPGSDKIIYYLGVLYEEGGSINDAVATYRKVPPVSGLYRDARLRLAYRFKENGEMEKAKDVLREGIRKKPTEMEFYQYLGGIYEREGDYGSAIKVLIGATKTSPNDEKLFFAVGTLYDKAKDVKKAVETMRKVLKINPKNASAMNYIGYTFVEKGEDLREAEDLLQEAARLAPDDGYIIDSLGWLYYVKGDLTRAAFLLKRAVEILPDEPTVLKHMGQIYLEEGKKKDALKYFQKALRAYEKKENVNVENVEEILSLIEKAMGK